MPHLAAASLAQPTHATINTIVWAVGLVLQLALVTTLVLRHIARRFPCFTTLIGFYLLRSALLFLSYGHLDAENYRTIYEGLLLFELLAQTVVAFELIHHLMRSLGGWTLRRAVVPAVFLLLSSLCTIFAAARLPIHVPIPIDRTQLFFSFLMLLLFVWALSIPASPLLRGITAGFALYGIVNISANLGRTYAAIHNDASLYVTWSYAIAGIYLLVVLFWLLTLQRPQNLTAL